ncbi:MAG: hypothetical protein DVB25_03000 [Verrucomicrobia bacterium]|nr:MAG: hypothetical protein DVB25_03000 [Verrucomicrobiota bacterium]
MKYIDRLKYRLKYKTKTITRVKNGLPVQIKLQAKRFPLRHRKMHKVRRFARYAAVIILSIATACAITYLIGGSSAPPAE